MEVTNLEFMKQVLIGYTGYNSDSLQEHTAECLREIISKETNIIIENRDFLMSKSLELIQGRYKPHDFVSESIYENAEIYTEPKGLLLIDYNYYRYFEVEGRPVVKGIITWEIKTNQYKKHTPNNEPEVLSAEEVKQLLTSKGDKFAEPVTIPEQTLQLYPFVRIDFEGFDDIIKGKIRPLDKKPTPTNAEFMLEVVRNIQELRRATLEEHIIAALYGYVKGSEYIRDMNLILREYSGASRKRRVTAILIKKSLELMQGRYDRDEPVDEFLSYQYEDKPHPYGLSLSRHRLYQLNSYGRNMAGVVAYHIPTRTYTHYKREGVEEMNPKLAHYLVYEDERTDVHKLGESFQDFEYILTYANIDFTSGLPSVEFDAVKYIIEDDVYERAKAESAAIWRSQAEDFIRESESIIYESLGFTELDLDEDKDKDIGKKLVGHLTSMMRAEYESELEELDLEGMIPEELAELED